MELPDQSSWSSSLPLEVNSTASSYLIYSQRLPEVPFNLSAESVPFQGSSTLMTAVIYLVVFAVGLTGNTLTIYVMLRYAKMKTVTNIYILNLAVADELYILGLPFLTTQNVLSYWPFGSFLCRVVMMADSMNQFTSIFCLTVMSIDRYLAVVHPIRSTKWRHPRVAKVVSAAVWAVSFVVVLPVVIFSDVQEKFHSCNMIWPEPQNVWSTAFILYTATLGLFAPLLVICLCYLLIVIKVKTSRARAGFTKRRRSERKVTRMVVVIVVVFVLCWLPFFIINIINLVVIIPESSTTAGIYFFTVILSYANSCANPVLYGFLSDNLKQSFRRVVCFRSVRCKGSGVDEGDHSAPRTEKTTAQDGVMLSPRDPLYQDHRSSQISPQLPDSPEFCTAADLQRGSSSTCPLYRQNRSPALPAGSAVVSLAAPPAGLATVTTSSSTTAAAAAAAAAASTAEGGTAAASGK